VRLTGWRGIQGVRRPVQAALAESSGRAHRPAMTSAIDPLLEVPDPEVDVRQPGEHPIGVVTEPPILDGLPRRLSDASRELFRVANRFVMVPLHQAGLAAWLGNPLTGWQCLLTTHGRRSGLARPTPLGYIVMEGAAWMMAGYGPRTQWYRNLLDDPRVELRLPGRDPIVGIAGEAADPATRTRIIPALCRSMALPGLMIGCFPPTSPDERILECVSWVPLVRVGRTDGQPILAGPDDPGGRGWVPRQGLLLTATLLPVGLARRSLRR
jgi:deazaflavin-dependent oxidoreductase (nitroreductase family)